MGSFPKTQPGEKRDGVRGAHACISVHICGRVRAHECAECMCHCVATYPSLHVCVLYSYTRTLQIKERPTIP